MLWLIKLYSCGGVHLNTGSRKLFQMFSNNTSTIWLFLNQHRIISDISDLPLFCLEWFLGKQREFSLSLAYIIFGGAVQAGVGVCAADANGSDLGLRVTHYELILEEWWISTVNIQMVKAMDKVISHTVPRKLQLIKNKSYTIIWLLAKENINDQQCLFGRWNCFFWLTLIFGIQQY